MAWWSPGPPRHLRKVPPYPKLANVFAAPARVRASGRRARRGRSRSNSPHAGTADAAHPDRNAGSNGATRTEIQAMERMPITAKGFAALEEELKKRQQVERPPIIEASSEARSHGDLSENAEYHAAKENQSLNEGRIMELES